MSDTWIGNEEIHEAFEAADGADSSGKFLGIIRRRYLRSFVGLLHALSSIVALALGNFAFVQVILRGIDNDNVGDSIKVAFHVSAAASGATLFFFYNKVQSWQLSTTSMKEKGLTSKQMQNFNQGRGVLSMTLSSAYPLLYHYLPVAVLQDTPLSILIALSILGVTIVQYRLIRDYGRIIFLVYGGSKMAFSIQVLWSGTLDAVQKQYPFAITFLEKESYFVVSCVEFGFLWYYLYSRRLVGKEIIQDLCKNYHPMLLYTWVGRLTADRWWVKLPWTSLSWVMLLYTLYAVIFLVKIFKSIAVAAKTYMSKGKEHKKSLRRSSIFEVDDMKGRRRSSVFEQIDVGMFHEKEE